MLLIGQIIFITIFESIVVNKHLTCLFIYSNILKMSQNNITLNLTSFFFNIKIISILYIQDKTGFITQQYISLPR